MIAPDTSVLVAGFATWHEGHEAAVRALNRGVHLIAHAAVETYSVLTRLPPPHRIALLPSTPTWRTSPPATTWHWMPAHIAA